MIFLKIQVARGGVFGVSRAFRYNLAAMVCTIFIGSYASANEPECVALINSETLLSLLMSGEAGNQAKDKGGGILLGATFDLESLQDYFFAAGWEFTDQGAGYTTSDPPSARYEADTIFALYEPRNFPKRLIFTYRVHPLDTSPEEDFI